MFDIRGENLCCGIHGMDKEEINAKFKWILVDLPPWQVFSDTIPNLGIGKTNISPA